MKQVTIRRCPVCQNIRGFTDSVAAALKGDEDLNVQVVDGTKGEFAVEVEGRNVSKLSSEILPTVAEVTNAVRGGVGAGA